MAKDDSGIVRSQYSNYLGTDAVLHENTEKSAKKHDVQVDIAKQQVLAAQINEKKHDYNYFAEQDVEAGYDTLNGVISTPSNIDMIDGLVDSEEEVSALAASKDSTDKTSAVKSLEERHSVLEALEKKKYALEKERDTRRIKAEALDQYIMGLADPELTFNAKRWNALVERVTVSRWDMVFRFRNGQEVTIEI